VRQIATALHEMSHFDNVADTSDFVYGPQNALNLAQTDPLKALQNADNVGFVGSNYIF